jgi:hypothetical protein
MVVTAFLQTVAARKIPVPMTVVNRIVEEENVQSRGTTNKS